MKDKISELTIQSGESKFTMSGNKIDFCFYNSQGIIQVFDESENCIAIIKPVNPNYSEWIKGLNKK